MQNKQLSIGYKTYKQHPSIFVNDFCHALISLICFGLICYVLPCFKVKLTSLIYA